MNQDSSQNRPKTHKIKKKSVWKCVFRTVFGSKCATPGLSRESRESPEAPQDDRGEPPRGYQKQDPLSDPLFTWNWLPERPPKSGSKISKNGTKKWSRFLKLFGYPEALVGADPVPVGRGGRPFPVIRLYVDMQDDPFLVGAVANKNPFRRPTQATSCLWRGWAISWAF